MVNRAKWSNIAPSVLRQASLFSASLPIGSLLNHDNNKKLLLPYQLCVGGYTMCGLQNRAQNIISARLKSIRKKKIGNGQCASKEIRVSWCHDIDGAAEIEVSFWTPCGFRGFQKTSSHLCDVKMVWSIWSRDTVDQVVPRDMKNRFFKKEKQTKRRKIFTPFFLVKTPDSLRERPIDPLAYHRDNVSLSNHF